MSKVLRILGTRGVPATHGGFETFAEQLALYLVSKGWRVIVYCQENGNETTFVDTWQEVERVRIFVRGKGPLSTILFDVRSIAHAAKNRDLCLTLGYNTALFSALLKIKGITNIINMDGIEWSRIKWGLLAKSWLWINDWIGCLLGNHLVADHPEIKSHLITRVSAQKITIIPYGADTVVNAPTTAIEALGLVSGHYLTVIARPEPENSLLEIVQGFSAKSRGLPLIVLGNYNDDNSYHKAVKAAASSEVIFVGAIYDKKIVQALRFHCTAYVHGHQVGGTNPSLVEAMGAGNAVIAHDNRFNRWVVGEGALYFNGSDQFSDCIDEIFLKPAKLRSLMEAGKNRFASEFVWTNVLEQYELLLNNFRSNSESNKR